MNKNVLGEIHVTNVQLLTVSGRPRGWSAGIAAELQLLDNSCINSFNLRFHLDCDAVVSHSVEPMIALGYEIAER